eukprot:CAMPEP_0202857834 /NCGR_PEP_ID=MMETSP1391-20130828/619_1 /ASSEMBLY_ACC=CAM_ASM_000867 /TAXON_ID=1034604 /ORGANISM="Chlamydomonas leiostraca, Strain SAG 11-49" /LENGTH=109 /DNA_ID=CAMNT_0049536691 /DNA_START=127 /DNA_END=456 /DNA_ORIENTATION=+
MATWTRERVAERLAALGFEGEEKGWLEVKLDAMKHEDKAFHLEGADGRVKGALRGLLPAAAAAAAQPQPGERSLALGWGWPGKFAGRKIYQGALSAHSANNVLSIALCA